jgi:hypothetical protein
MRGLFRVCALLKHAPYRGCSITGKYFCDEGTDKESQEYDILHRNKKVGGSYAGSNVILRRKWLN